MITIGGLPVANVLDFEQMTSDLDLARKAANTMGSSARESASEGANASVEQMAEGSAAPFTHALNEVPLLQLFGALKG